MIHPLLELPIFGAIWHQGLVFIQLHFVTLVGCHICSIACEMRVSHETVTFHCRVSHASLLKRLIKTMECTPKRVTTVTVTEKWICKPKILKPKIQQENATIQLSSCSKCRQHVSVTLGATDRRP